MISRRASQDTEVATCPRVRNLATSRHSRFAVRHGWTGGRSDHHPNGVPKLCARTNLRRASTDRPSPGSPQTTSQGRAFVSPALHNRRASARLIRIQRSGPPLIGPTASLELSPQAAAHGSMPARTLRTRPSSTGRLPSVSPRHRKSALFHKLNAHLVPRRLANEAAIRSSRLRANLSIE